MMYYFLMMLCFCIPLSAQRAFYENVVVENPYDLKALYNVGVLAFKENDYNAAQAAFNVLKDHCKEDICEKGFIEKIYYNAGNAEVKLELYADALESFEQVLMCNSNNQHAQEKIDYLKKLLEQQQNENESDSSSQGSRKESNNADDSENQDDQPEEGMQGKDDQEESQEQEDDQGNQSSKESDAGDNHQQKTESEKKQSDDGQGEEDQESDTSQEQSFGEKSDEESRADGPALTQQEAQLMAELQKYDEKMNEQLTARMMKGVGGDPYAQNNW